jgi:4-diphosphocytidyl-2-C-methyl-D-erythritol kinase
MDTNMDTSYFIQSYAKINLTLDILGKRPDGYHDLASIMQTIDLYDTICLAALPQDEMQLVCTRPELNTDGNLAVRAAQLVRERFSLSQGVRIELQKRIPVSAGLGGGSSNAAAVLLALQQWWQLPCSQDELLAMAATLGSDVPFFLYGGCALCEGRGERVTPLAPHWPAAMRWLLLVKPAIEVSTATVFRNLPPSDYTSDAHTRIVRDALQNKQAMKRGDLHNGLAHSVLERYPPVRQASEAMLQAGAPWAQLSGSGPTLFCFFARLDEATYVQQSLRTQGYEVYITHAIHQGVTHFFS